MGAKANIVIDQGTDFSTTISVADDDEFPVDLTGYTASAQMRKHYNSTSYYSFTTSFDSPRSLGKLTISMSRDYTANISPGRYMYDVELTSSANVRVRLVEGIATITPEVTR